MQEHIQNLNGAQAKLLLSFAVIDLRNAIYTPKPEQDAALLGRLTQTIETYAKENTDCDLPPTDLDGSDAQGSAYVQRRLWSGHAL